MKTLVLRMTGAIAIAAALVVGAMATGASAQVGSATLIVHSRVCPAGYAGTDIFNVCHGTAFLEASFFIVDAADNETSGSPDASGNVVFDGLAAGDYGFSGTFTGDGYGSLYCSYAEDAGNDIFTGVSVEGGVVLSFAEGDTIYCDAYFVPTGTDGGTDDGGTTGGVTTMPSTGTGNGGQDANLIAMMALAGATLLGGFSLVARRRNQ